MSSVSSIGNFSVTSSYSSGTYNTQRHQRPSSAQMANDLFSKLDTSGKGYIQQSDLENALSGLNSSSASSSGTASASDIFSQLDSDGDGKVTKDEMTSGFEKLAQELDNQFDQSRMQGAIGNMPPPPPQDDAGFSKDELQSQIDEIGSSDSQRSSLLTNIVQNFDAADTNQDGKISISEAMAYDKSSTSSSSTGSSGTATSTTTASSRTTDAQVFRQLIELLRAYGGGEGSSSTTSSVISALA